MMVIEIVRINLFRFWKLVCLLFVFGAVGRLRGKFLFPWAFRVKGSY